MRSKNVSLYLLSLALLCGAACKAPETGSVSGKSKESLVAMVNGAAITEDDIYLKLQGGHAGSITPEMRERAIKDLINQELLYQQGVKLGLDKDAKYQNAVRIMEKRLQEFKRAEMARRVASTRIAATVTVTDEDVNRYIDANADRLKSEFHLGMLRFASESEAKEALSRIKGGASFDSMARATSRQAPGRGQATWDLGYLKWNQIPSEWREAAERLEKGAVSEVLFGKGTGFCIIKLIDRKKNPKSDLASMRAGITMRLRDEKVAEAYEGYLETLNKEASIKRFDERR
jgi:peptidyl-prolyl cis-trans isomerase C